MIYDPRPLTPSEIRALKALFEDGTFCDHCFQEKSQGHFPGCKKGKK
jgi:hypothetical protein